MKSWQKISLFAVCLIALFFGIGAQTLIRLTEQVTGILPAANGGTNTSTGYPSTLSYQTQLTSAVTLGTNSYTASSGTFPSVTTVGAGTWLVGASLDLQTTSATAAVQISCRLYDGTNVLANGQFYAPVTSAAAVKYGQLSMTNVVTESGSVTFTAACTSATASQLLEPAVSANSGGNLATTILAVRIK